MKAKKVGLALAATAAVLMTSASFADATSATSVAANVVCAGVNSCKGQSICKTATNTCKGMNSCKGTGIVMMSADQCSKLGGKVYVMSNGTFVPADNSSTSSQ